MKLFTYLYTQSFIYLFIYPCIYLFLYSYTFLSFFIRCLLIVWNTSALSSNKKKSLFPPINRIAKGIESSIFLFSPNLIKSIHEGDMMDENQNQNPKPTKSIHILYRPVFKTYFPILSYIHSTDFFLKAIIKAATHFFSIF